MTRLLLLLAVLGMGCGEEQRPNRWADLHFETEKRSIEACFKRGKSVIRSSWNGRVKDCR